MVQLSLREGLQRFGQRGKEGALKEMRQLHDMKTFFPRDPKTLTREERKRALSSLIFLKEKESGEVKGRTCVNGAPQRQYIRKEDAASPTVATDSVFLTGAIDAYQRRDVAYIDLPGAFLHTLTDEKVIMVLRGELCELMCLIDPKLYRKHVCKDRKGQPVLYVELYKSLYGLMRSALLFYRKLRKELENYGMKMNPYDLCVANKDTRHGQLTVLWHVDDLKISCKNKIEVTKLICYLRNIYGDKMTIKRGGRGKYLGMNLDFTEPGVFKVDMCEYVREIIDGFPEEITKTSPTPHSDGLFTIKEDESAEVLSEDDAMQFHRTTAQLLFLSTRARKDIQTAVSFLTTRVKKPDKDDWRKIRKVLEYLNGTVDLKLRVEVKDLRVMRWFVDAAHMVHWDCKGQTGAAMTMGRGAVLSYSWKQKVNTKSSTETELVGVDDAISNILWSLYFLQEQGCGTQHAIIYQDNKSAILLESNGKWSSGKRTKHIKAKYFFVTDKVADGDVVIAHTPTETMWADMNTKPKQGRGFRVDRSYMMNCPVDLNVDVDDASVFEIQETNQSVSENNERFSPSKNRTFPMTSRQNVSPGEVRRSVLGMGENWEHAGLGMSLRQLLERYQRGSCRALGVED
eukprot:CCRYP_018085-RG/>CCRYP_018085-RG protein AED:0.29 eAED:0.29 QI:0/-1/0/1/-1/1/1/0/626